MEIITSILISLHILLGTCALFSGAIAIIVKKGSSKHKISGKIYYFSMLLSALISLLISSLPEHKNSFLFSIGLFTIYLLIASKRAVHFKRSDHSFRIDQLISTLFLIVNLCILYSALFNYASLQRILFIFGIAGLYFSIRDLILFRDSDKARKHWLRLHLGKMTGAYLASITAVLVVNFSHLGFIIWFVPTIIGLPYIIYWLKKVSVKNQ